MDTDCDTFFRLVTSELQGTSNSLRLREAKRETEPYGCFLYLANDVAGLRISNEPYEGGVFVQISALSNGEFPDYPREVDNTTVLRTFDLEDVVVLAGSTADWNESSDLSNRVSRAVAAISEFGRPILLGDFTQFSSLEARVKDRARHLRNA